MTPDVKDLADVLVRATRSWQEAVKLLRNMANAEAISKKCIDINRLENEADSILRAAVARLFDEEQDTQADHQVEGDLREPGERDRPLRGRRQHHRRRRPGARLARWRTVSILVVITIAIALGFDFINGFHDAANSIATVVSTRVLTPQVGGRVGGVLQLRRLFIFAPKVADTIAKIVAHQRRRPGLRLRHPVPGSSAPSSGTSLTWWWGLPTSSSHALIGGFAGAGVAHAGWHALRLGQARPRPSRFIVIAPVLGFGARLRA